MYRAVDKQGETVDFLLTAKRDMGAAKRLFDQAMAAYGAPDKVAMDKSSANKAAIDDQCRPRSAHHCPPSQIPQQYS